MVFVDAYPLTTTDFSTILTKVRAANPDVLGGATRFEEGVAIPRQLKALNVNPRMVGLASGAADVAKFYGSSPKSVTAVGAQRSRGRCSPCTSTSCGSRTRDG